MASTLISVPAQVGAVPLSVKGVLVTAAMLTCLNAIPTGITKPSSSTTRPAPKAQDPDCRISPGQSIDRKIARGEEVACTITLPTAGDYVLKILQKNIDVALKFTNENSGQIERYDAPFRESSWEQVLLEAVSPVSRTVHIEAIDASNLEGQLGIQLERIKSAASSNRRCSRQLWELSTRATMLDYSHPKRAQVALAMFQASAAIGKECGNQAQQARSLHATAALLDKQERREEALATYLRAAALYNATRRPLIAGWTRYAAGSKLVELDRITEARELYLAELKRSPSSPRLVSALENYIGVTYYYGAEYSQAEAWWTRRLHLFN